MDRTRLGYQETEVYLPVFEFYVDGKKYIKESVSGDSKAIYEIGQKISVVYNKNNPKDAFLEKDRKGKIIVSILLTVATLLGGGYVLMSYIK